MCLQEIMVKVLIGNRAFASEMIRVHVQYKPEYLCNQEIPIGWSLTDFYNSMLIYSSILEYDRVGCGPGSEKETKRYTLSVLNCENSQVIK